MNFWKSSLSILIIIGLSPFSNLSGQDAELPGTKAQYQKNYEERIQQTHLHGMYIPLDLTEAFVELKKRIDPADLKSFKEMQEDVATIRLHYSFGRWIIHNWGFYGGSRLSHYIKKMGVTHPDDMAQLILASFHRSLNDKKVNLKELIQYYKDKRKSIALKQNPSLKAIFDHNEKVMAEKESKENASGKKKH